MLDKALPVAGQRIMVFSTVQYMCVKGVASEKTEFSRNSQLLKYCKPTQICEGGGVEWPMLLLAARLYRVDSSDNARNRSHCLPHLWYRAAQWVTLSSGR